MQREQKENKARGSAREREGRQCLPGVSARSRALSECVSRPLWPHAWAPQAAAPGSPRLQPAWWRLAPRQRPPPARQRPRQPPPRPNFTGVGVLSACPLQPAGGEPRPAIPGPRPLSALAMGKVGAGGGSSARLSARAPRWRGARGPPGTGCLWRRLLLVPVVPESQPRRSPHPSLRGWAPSNPFPCRAVRREQEQMERQ